LSKPVLYITHNKRTMENKMFILRSLKEEEEEEVRGFQ
jgi:hypothetical protein